MTAVGDTAPDFTLKDQNGNDVTLSSFRGQAGRDRLLPVHVHRRLRGRALRDPRRPVARSSAPARRCSPISCDTRHAQRMWAEQQGFTFPVLSDFWPHGEVSKAYGVFNEALGCANRATFVLDKDGSGELDVLLTRPRHAPRQSGVRRRAGQGRLNPRLSSSRSGSRRRGR